MEECPPSYKARNWQTEWEMDRSRNTKSRKMDSLWQEKNGTLKWIWDTRLILGLLASIKNDSSTQFDLENQCQFLIKLSIFLSVNLKDLDSVTVPVNLKAASFNSPPWKVNTNLLPRISGTSGAMWCHFLTDFSNKLHWTIYFMNNLQKMSNHKNYF